MCVRCVHSSILYVCRYPTRALSRSKRRRSHLCPNTYPAPPAHAYTGTSNAHADSTGTQLETLQAVFRRLQSGEIGEVEGDWKYQLGSGGNKIVTAEQWKERLPKSFLWIDFCCIPQMSIPLTEELLGFGDRRRSSLLVVQDLATDSVAPRPARARRTSFTMFKAAFRTVRRDSIEHDNDDDDDDNNDAAARVTAAVVPDVSSPLASVLVDNDNDNDNGEDGDSVCVAAVGGDKGATTDHRHISTDTEGWKKVNKIMLGKAVESIPAYIERSSLIIALVPPCKHADREDEICDEGSWRGRGWCRVEYLGATLVRSNVSVMVVQDATTTPAFVWPVDGLTLPPGHGTYTCCSRKIENVLHPAPEPCMLLPCLPSFFSMR
jgi:hypothetical protein